VDSYSFAHGCAKHSPRDTRPQAARGRDPWWGACLFVLEAPRTLIGWGGFKGPPRDGVVELGYEVAASWQGRGLASAAVRELLQEALDAPEVLAVLAHTRPEPGASVRVLEKAGFGRECEVADDRIGTAWRFRLDRPSD